jgi:hypothetical protein
MHRSGECNCGCFAAPGERQDLLALFPAWFHEHIRPLEKTAKRMGLAGCRWGERPHEIAQAAGPLCSDCQLRLDSVA